MPVPKSWCEAYALFLKGESDGIVTYSASYLYHQLMEKSFEYAFLVFEEGHPLQIEVAGILHNTVLSEWAKKLLAFIVSGSFQSTLPLQQWMHPVIDVSLPTGWVMSSSKQYQFDSNYPKLALRLIENGGLLSGSKPDKAHTMNSNFYLKFQSIRLIQGMIFLLLVGGVFFPVGVLTSFIRWDVILLSNCWRDQASLYESIGFTVQQSALSTFPLL